MSATSAVPTSQHAMWRLSGNLLPPLASFVIGIAAWEVAARAAHLPTYVFPPPTMVLAALVQNFALLLSQLGVTVAASVIGFIISVLLGITAGALISVSSTLDRMLTPWLVVAHAIPKVVIAPLFLIWFGFGMRSEVFFVVAFTFFPVVVNTIAGLRGADPDLLQMVRSMGATRWKTLVKIRLPGALPSIFTGIKLSVTLAPVGAVIGEFVASNSGLGHLLVQAVGDMETPLAFAAVAVFSVFGVLVWKFAEWIERRSLPWHASQREGRRRLV